MAAAAASAADLAPLEFLPMNPRDVAEIMAVESRVYSHPWSAGNFTDSIQAGYGCWVARAGGQLLGYLVLMPSLDETHLLNICVAVEMQGRGYGARLLRYAMEVSRRAGAATMLLEVRPSNGPALRLYQHFGFRQIGRRKGYYPAQEGREDALVLRRALTESAA